MKGRVLRPILVLLNRILLLIYIFQCHLAPAAWGTSDTYSREAPCPAFLQVKFFWAATSLSAVTFRNPATFIEVRTLP